MRRRLFLLGILACATCVWAVPPSGASTKGAVSLLYRQVPARLYELAMQGTQQNYCMDLRGARKSFQSMIDEFPDHPGGPMCLAGLVAFEMMVLDDHSQEKAFLDLIALTIRLSNGEEKNGNKVAACFFRGAAYGYRGYFKVEKKEWVGAIRDARSMAGELKKAVKLDPQCYEAYYGLGLHDYYRSKASKSLDFLPFFEDRTKEGLKEIELCAERAMMTHIGARAALMEMYLDEGLVADAERTANWMVEHYPAYWYSYWILGSIMKKQNRLDEAVQVYQKAIQAVDGLLPDFEVERLRFQMRQAEVYVQMNRMAEARKVYGDVIQWKSVCPGTRQDKIDSVKQAAATKLNEIPAQS